MDQGADQKELGLMTAAAEIPTCQYCGKTFRKMSTLSAHLCEKKRRWQQEKEVGVQLGFKSFIKFYEMTQGSAKSKNYEQFVESSYYSAFVKFGQYLVSIRAINIPMFIEWIIKNNKRLDQWTKEAFYDEYLFDYLRKEHPNDALERSLLEMQKWADEHEVAFNVFFTTANANRICTMITNGRISPWVIFNCDSGLAFLSGLNPEQLSIIYKFIDPEFWGRKFRDYIGDTEFMKSVLSGAKL